MKKIIVIEDDKVLREALTALLRENGYEVCRIVKFEKTEQQIAAVSYTHLTLPTNISRCRSRWSPYH